MPFDGSGNFTRSYNWTADKLAGIKIESERMDGEFDNFATAMNQTMLRSGAIPWTGDLKMGGNKIIGLGNGTAPSPAVQFLADTTTGIFLQSAGNLGLSAAGIERMRLNATGATVFGTLTTNAAVVTSGAGSERAYASRTGALERWRWGADSNPEGGANGGSNFFIARYDDATGAYVGSPLIINRATGAAAFANALSVGGSLTVTGSVQAGSFSTPFYFSTYSDASVSNIYFDNRVPQAYFSYAFSNKTFDFGVNGAIPVSFNSTNFTVRVSFMTTMAAQNISYVVSTGSYVGLSLETAAGQPGYIFFKANGVEHGRITGSGGAIQFSTSAAATATFTIAASGFLISPQTYANVSGSVPNLGIAADGTFYRSNVAMQPVLGFTPVQQGGGTGQGTNKIYLGWAAGGLKATVDATDLGVFAFLGTSQIWTGPQLHNADIYLYGGASLFFRNPAGSSNRWQMFLGLAEGGSNTGSDFFLRGYTDAGAGQAYGDVFYIVRQTGFVRFPASVNSVTAAAANMNMDGAGQLYRVTSSLRYKEDVQDYALAGFDMLRPVTYKSRVDDGDFRYVGLIAEEVHDVGLTEFVEYDKEGRPDALRYPSMVAMLIAEVQALKARVVTLEGGTPEPRIVPPTRPNPPPRPTTLPEPFVQEPQPFPEPVNIEVGPEWVPEPIPEPDPVTWPPEPLPPFPELVAPPTPEVPEPVQFPAPDDVPLPEEPPEITSYEPGPVPGPPPFIPDPEPDDPES